MNRKQTEQIKKDLAKKMVFLVGPRQVGKTWLANGISKDFTNPVYLNFDRAEDREIIRKESWLQNTDLLILDELHKMKNWKNYLKGVFDTKNEKLKILVTGSARLNTFRQSGDSLAGRFFLHRLLPFSLSEIKNQAIEVDIQKFITRGGFPEPLFSDTDTDADRWRQQYFDGLLRTDILDFETVHDFRAIQTTLELLRKKVGSPISYASLALDVQVSPATVRKYIEIFESLYIVFRVTPYSKNIARSILKEAKLYFYDTGLVLGDQGAKFENFVGVSLLKHVWGKTDYLGKNFNLNYIRTKEGKEVDFALTENNELSELIEVKYADGNLSKNLKYFSDKYKIKGTQIVNELKRERVVDNIEIVSAEKYLKDLFL